MTTMMSRTRIATVEDAVEIVKRWAIRDLTDGLLALETVHLVVQSPFDKSLQIVSVVSNGDAGEFIFGAVMRFARALRPVAAIKMDPAYEGGNVCGVDVALQDATWMVTRFRCDVPADGFRFVRRRHLREGYETPYLPDAWDQMVAEDVWSECLEHDVPAGRRAYALDI